MPRAPQFSYYRRVKNKHMLDPVLAPPTLACHIHLVRLVGIAPSLQEEVLIVVKQDRASLVVV